MIALKNDRLSEYVLRNSKTFSKSSCSDKALEETPDFALMSFNS